MGTDSDSKATVALRLTIRGRVQGVGFRYCLAEEARSRNLCGWVRNRRDGSVEAVIAGFGPDVDAIVAWSHRGPPGARVTTVETAEAEGAFASFVIAPTA
jgi:acylphosphatase